MNRVRISDSMSFYKPNVCWLRQCVIELKESEIICAENIHAIYKLIMLNVSALEHVLEFETISAKY